MNKIFKYFKTTFIVIACFVFVISCEKDFTDVGSNVVSNTKFDVDAELVDITIENSPLTAVKADNITRELGQYLLGVYNSSDFEKLEASIVSQLLINPSFTLVQDTYVGDTTVISTIDTVYLKIPYQFTVDVANSNAVELDSVFGDATKPFAVNVYRSNSFLNRFNPLDPSKLNNYDSDFTYQKTGSELNVTKDFALSPSKNDTTAIIKRRLNNGTVYKTDSISYFLNASSEVKVPAAKIALNETMIKQLFLDKVGSAEFSNQDAFNDYFRGLIIEATGTESNLISLNFNNQNTILNPSIEIFYTNTVLKGGSTIVDTIPRLLSLPLSGIRVNTFKMNERTYPLNNEIKVQGAAGSEAKLTLLSQTKLDELRSKNWLINDAELTLYINQSTDTTNVPFRLYLFKVDNTGKQGQILDATTEASFGGIRGQLIRDDNGNKDRYVFKLTDYISELLNGNISKSSTLKLKTFNPSDNPVSEIDTIFTNYSWNHKAVTLFNHDVSNGARKATFKISYSIKK